MGEPKFPFVHVPLLGHDSGAGAIMGSVVDGIKQAERDGLIERDEARQAIREFREAAWSGSYDDLLRLTMATVETRAHGD